LCEKRKRNRVEREEEDERDLSRLLSVTSMISFCVEDEDHVRGGGEVRFVSLGSLSLFSCFSSSSSFEIEFEFVSQKKFKFMNMNKSD
jgi:hypothetical protein